MPNFVVRRQMPMVTYHAQPARQQGPFPEGDRHGRFGFVRLHHSSDGWFRKPIEILQGNPLLEGGGGPMTFNRGSLVKYLNAEIAYFNEHPVPNQPPLPPRLHVGWFGGRIGGSSDERIRIAYQRVFACYQALQRPPQNAGGEDRSNGAEGPGANERPVGSPRTRSVVGFTPSVKDDYFFTNLKEDGVLSFCGSCFLSFSEEGNSYLRSANKPSEGGVVYVEYYQSLATVSHSEGKALEKQIVVKSRDLCLRIKILDPLLVLGAEISQDNLKATLRRLMSCLLGASLFREMHHYHFNHFSQVGLIMISIDEEALQDEGQRAAQEQQLQEGLKAILLAEGLKSLVAL